ncbi:MAG: ribosome maturation factor RimM, partial [Intestinibacter sp.]
MTEKLTVFRVGQIVNTQGLKGEVRVYPYTDDIYRFDDLEYFYTEKSLNNKYEVERVRYKGNMVIMKIKDIDSIDLAERLKTKNMYIPREESVELEEGEFFVADLIGLDVFTIDGEKIG